MALENPPLPSTQKKPLSPRRKLFYSVVVCAMAAVMVLAAGEVYIRLWGPIDEVGWYELTDDPILFYRLTPDFSGDDHGHRRTQTAQRLRGPWVFEEQPAPGVRRVLWVGDSACFGSGCDDTQTAPFQFHKIAKASGVAVDSIDLAVVGYNVRQVRDVLARRSTEFRGADTVIYYHHENDIVNAPWFAVAHRVPWNLYWEYEAPQNFAKKLVKRSAVVRRLWNTDLLVQLRGASASDAERAVIRTALADRSLSLPISPFTKTCVDLYDNAHEHGRRFRDELFTMADRAESMNARFVMVYWPSRTLLHHEELIRLRRTLSSWCDEKNILFVDVTDAFLAAETADIYADTIHPGPDGQLIIANAVFNAWSGGPSAPP